MKNALLFLVLAALGFSSCEKNTPEYSIEGKWIWSPSENRADANSV